MLTSNRDFESSLIRRGESACDGVVGKICVRVQSALPKQLQEIVFYREMRVSQHTVWPLDRSTIDVPR
jgi:hypothetical protein